MGDSFRIPAPDDEVLAAVGRAVYNFSYLEWKVIYATSWLRGDTSEVSQLAKCDGGTIAREFRRAVDECAKPDDAHDLRAWAEEFAACVKQRNDLLHAHPYTADTDRRQGLWRVRQTGEGFSVAVTADDVREIARRFDCAATGYQQAFERLRPRAA